MRIRRAADSDRAAIAGLHTASWQDSYRFIIPDDQLDHVVPGRIAAQWQDGVLGAADAVLIAEDETGGPLGFCATWDGESPYIDAFHVAASARSQGIGRKLLAETARHFLAIGRRRAHLDVIAANRNARRLYLAMGGRPAGIRDVSLFGTIVPNERIEWNELGLLLERASEPGAEG